MKGEGRKRSISNTFRTSQEFQNSVELPSDNQTIILQRNPLDSITKFSHFVIGTDHRNMVFEEVYSPLIPFFLRKNKECQCLQTIHCCANILEMLNPRTLRQMKLQFLEYRSKASISSDDIVESTYLPEVLHPHLLLLRNIIKLNHLSQQSVESLLAHCKTDELTFWSFCELVAHVPPLDRFRHEVSSFMEDRCSNIWSSLKTSQTFNVEQFIQDCHKSKLANTIPVQFYCFFFKMLITTKAKKYFSKVFICYLLYIGGIIEKAEDDQLQDAVKMTQKNLDMDWQSIIEAASRLQG